MNAARNGEIDNPSTATSSFSSNYPTSLTESSTTSLQEPNTAFVYNNYSDNNNTFGVLQQQGQIDLLDSQNRDIGEQQSVFDSVLYEPTASFVNSLDGVEEGNLIEFIVQDGEIILTKSLTNPQLSNNIENNQLNLQEVEQTPVQYQFYQLPQQTQQPQHQSEFQQEGVLPDPSNYFADLGQGPDKQIETVSSVVEQLPVLQQQLQKQPRRRARKVDPKITSSASERYISYTGYAPNTTFPSSVEANPAVPQQLQVSSVVAQVPAPPAVPQFQQVQARPQFPQQVQARPQFPQQVQARPQFPQQVQARPQFPQQVQARPAFPQEVQARPAFPQQVQARPAFSQQFQARPAFPQQFQARPAFPQQGQANPAVTESVKAETAVVQSVVANKLESKHSPVKKPINRFLLEQKSRVRFGFASPKTNKSTHPDFSIPSSINRWLDEKRNIPVLSPSSVAVRFCRVDRGKKEKSEAFLTSNLIASSGEKFCRVLLGSDIEKLGRENKTHYNTCTWKLQRGILKQEDDPIPASNLIIPRNTLIIRHPVIKRDQANPVFCVFPVEKVLKDGTRVQEVQRTIVQRDIEAQQVQLQFEDLGDIRTYLGSLPPFENGMEQNNQFLNFFLQSDGNSQPISEGRGQLFPSQQPTRVFYAQAQGINSPIQPSSFSNQQGSFVYAFRPSQFQLPMTIITHQQHPISVNSSTASDGNPNTMAISSNVHHNNHISSVEMIGNTISALSKKPVSVSPDITNLSTPVKKSKAKVQPKVNVVVQTVNHPDGNTSALVLQGTSMLNDNNTIFDSVNQHNNTAIASYNGSVSQVSNVPIINNSSRSPAKSMTLISNNVPSVGSSVSHNISSVHNRDPPQVLPNSTAMAVQPFLTNHVGNASPARSVIQTTDVSTNIAESVKANGLAGVVSQIQISQTEESQTTSVIVKQEEVKEEEKPSRLRFIVGYVARCKNCGICSDDLHMCTRCKSKIPEDTKIMRDSWAATSQKIPMTTGSTPSSPFGNKSGDVKQDTSLKRGHVKKAKSEAAATPRRRGGGRRQEECIVLSSDEEDEPKAKLAKQETQVATTSLCVNSPSKLVPVLTKTVQVNLLPLQMELTKGNYVTDPSAKTAGTKILHLSPMTMIATARPEIDTDLDEVIKTIENSLASSTPSGPYTTVVCRSIRVGDYKCVAPSSIQQNFKVVFHKRGILFTVPHAELKNTTVKCCVPADQILQMQVHFRQRLPVIFITGGPKNAGKMRKRLGLSEDSSKSPFYCSQNGDQCQKFITFLADDFKETDVAVIKQTYGKLILELDYMKANETLMNITPEHVHKKDGNPRSQTSTIVAANAIMKCSSMLTSNTNHIIISSSTPAASDPEPKQVDCSSNKQLLSYEGMAICQNDVLCLALEQFLNDSILDFWMRYMEHEILSPFDRARTYMFSTFFYKRLTTRPKRRGGANEDDSNLTPAEKRHARVKRWTKKVDIFEKDFIFIPINENCHWFMAVICYPGLMGVHNLETGEAIPDYNKRRAKGKGKSSSKAAAVHKIEQCNGDNASEDSSIKDEAGVPNLDLIDQEGSKQNPKSPEESGKIKVKQPCILILDSLAGETRSRVYSTLREYLKMEYKTRKGVDRDFTKTCMPGSMPNVPQQPNHCDCGIFTLFYVECFFKKPIKTFDFPIEDGIIEWKKMRWETKREEIYNCIQDLVRKQNAECLQFVPALTFPPLKAIKAKEKERLKEQIDSTPIEKVRQVSPSEEPMDIDVNMPSSSSSSDEGGQSYRQTGGGSPRVIMPVTSALMPSIVEMTAASPRDNDHDHDYAPNPNRTKPVD